VSKTPAQIWAFNRNWLIARIRGARSVIPAAKRTLPDNRILHDLIEADFLLQRALERLEELNTYQKYQEYLNNERKNPL